jgi:hypothetical protein
MSDNSANLSSGKPSTGTLIKKKAKRYFYYVLALVVTLIVVYVWWSFFFTYSEGTRTGLLQKFSKKGNVFKTYEGELILSSVQSTKNVALASDKFLFSVSDPEVALQLEKLQGKMVDVHYKEKNNTLPWRGDSPFLVLSVKLNQ